MLPIKPWMMVYRPVQIDFKAIHFDKAGETFEVRLLKAEIIDEDGTEAMWLLPRSGLPVSVPLTNLFPAGGDDTPVEKQTYRCGYELTREFHPAEGQPRTIRRWLNRAELDAMLAAEGR